MWPFVNDTQHLIQFVFP